MGVLVALMHPANQIGRHIYEEKEFIGYFEHSNDVHLECMWKCKEI